MKWIIAGLFSLISFTSYAQEQMCGTHEEIVKKLKEFNETPIGAGLNSPDIMTEIFSSANGETWTIVINQSNGRSCVVAVGKDWRSFNEKGETI